MRKKEDKKEKIVRESERIHERERKRKEKMLRSKPFRYIF